MRWYGFRVVALLAALTVTIALVCSSTSAQISENPFDEDPSTSESSTGDEAAQDRGDDAEDEEDAAYDGDDLQYDDLQYDDYEALGDQSASVADLTTEDVLVTARVEEMFRASGSVHLIDEEQLERLSYNDPMAVLAQVPGVYVRSEEGYGLRPNIGLRGAAAERSRKITLLEDGVLMAPAPYSAPAAYYFPLIARMVGVDITAGSAAIVHGPNTIGGAIDFQGRRIPYERTGQVDLSLGNTWFGRAHLHYGESNAWGGFLVDAIHVRSSGFHELDAYDGADDDTGFHRTDILLRGDLHGDLDGEWYHRLELSLGLGLEESRSSYLGTSDADFRANPYRRYAATQLDNMQWWRTRAHLRYELESDTTRLAVVAYRHDFERTWYRVDRFCDTLVNEPGGARDTCTASVGFDRVLLDPSGFASRYERLTGSLEPSPGDAPLFVARNHRVFASQGLQANAVSRFETGPLSHGVQYGARIHYDSAAPEQTGDTYYLRSRQMVLQVEDLQIDRRRSEAWALSLYANWSVTLEHLTITPGLRTELVWMTSQDDFTQTIVDGEQFVLLPGLGAQYELTPDLAAFAGMHLGYSPVAPGSGGEVVPEAAWNYEIGARYGRVADDTHAELTYFVSDYQNLSSVCTLAAGCSAELLDRQIDGGAALILGIETEVSHQLEFDEVKIPLSMSYTWTWTRFETSFDSPNPQWGAVQVGHRVPYVPEHQFSARAGVSWRMLSLEANGLYVSAMRDVAGYDDPSRPERTDAYFMLDAMVRVELMRRVRVYLRGENLTDSQPIATRRAWGARGVKPVLVQGGLQVDIR